MCRMFYGLALGPWEARPQSDEASDSTDAWDATRAWGGDVVNHDFWHSVVV